MPRVRRSASTVLQHPLVDFAVFEVARGGILREGLGYSRNDVAVVLNVTGDHLGLGGINSLRQLAGVKQVIVEAVPRDGTAVLNADDPLVAAMGRQTSGSVIYFSMDPENDRVKFQASRGRRAVTLEKGRNGEMIVLRQGRKSMPLVWTHLLPATFEGRARMNVQNALAAAGRRVGRRGASPRHPAGAADLHDQLLHGAGTPEHVRARRLPGDRRLRPQPARRRCARAVRRQPHRADAGRGAGAGHRPPHRRHRDGRGSARRGHRRDRAHRRPALRPDHRSRGREQSGPAARPDGGVHRARRAHRDGCRRGTRDRVWRPSSTRWMRRATRSTSRAPAT